MATYTIGFTNKMYTLWSVEIDNKFLVKTINGESRTIGTYDEVKGVYIQNLSFDFDKAVERFKELKGEKEPYLVDLNLRGTSSFERNENFHIDITCVDWNSFPNFTFFQKGLKISEMGELGATYDYNRSKYYENKALIDLFICFRDGKEGFNVYNLPGTFLYRKNTRNGNYNNENLFEDSNPRHAVNAKKRLIELGLIKNVDGKWLTEKEIKDLEIKKKKSESVFYYNEGDKVELKIKLINSTSYDSVYGYIFIHTYVDVNGREFIYKGGSPKDISEDEFMSIKATIKHNEYNGMKQTLLQRMKIIK